MTDKPKQTRFRAEKLRALLEEAKAIPGAQVKGNLRTGEFSIEFPADGKPMDNAEGERIEQAMNETMPPKKRA